MGDNNTISGRVTSREGDRLTVEEGPVRTAVIAPGDTRDVGDTALVSVRAAAVEVDESAGRPAGNSAECEIVFVEYLGDLVKLHLSAGSNRMLAKVPGDRYPSLRGREGETIRITWQDEDVQLLRS